MHMITDLSGVAGQNECESVREPFRKLQITQLHEVLL